VSHYYRPYFTNQFLGIQTSKRAHKEINPTSILVKLLPLENINSCHHIKKNQRIGSILFRRVLVEVNFLLNFCVEIVTDLINTLPGNSSVNTVQQATIEEAVVSVVPTDAPIDRLDSDHVICVYCRSMSVPRQNSFRAVTSYELRVV
jgi:hypothetical protein